MDFSRDYYEILGLDSNATSEDIKRAYRELVKKYHPDANRSAMSEELFKLISEAYDVLSDDARRRQYDLYRKFENEELEEEKRRASDNTPASAHLSDECARGQPAARAYGMDRVQLLVLSLIVPGYYQISSGEKKLGYMLFAIYFIFWALAFIQSLPIGILAIAIWLYSLYDAYAHSRG
ncbi:MAG: DnaJ domain-containing protein [Methanotrichaceae archaeon]|nr:DnaJ domain-containing protein [Methanotrichaceae archaeon]